VNDRGTRREQAGLPADSYFGNFHVAYSCRGANFFAEREFLQQNSKNRLISERNYVQQQVLPLWQKGTASSDMVQPLVIFTRLCSPKLMLKEPSQ
jgi:hypothetical protein